MKKIAFLLVTLLMSVSASAQFEKGKVYAEASLTGFDMSSQANKFHLGLGARGGSLFMDNLMALGEAGYNHLKGSNDSYSFGAGVRYYIIQNGLYLGAMAKFKHNNLKENDFMPGVHVGYAFFLNGTVTVEPELYMDFSTNKFEDSCYGLGIGIGIYL